MIGYMVMPEGFVYKDVFVKGQPVHQKYDDFRLKHPRMENGHRAKLFSPFDALAGFSEAVTEKETLYEFKRELSDEEKEEIDRRLSILHRLTYTRKTAAENNVRVCVTYYIPCADRNNFAYGSRGQYVSVSGVCLQINRKYILVGGTYIMLNDIAAIESGKIVDGRNIFDFPESDEY